MVRVSDVMRKPRATMYPDTPLLSARRAFRDTEERVIPIVKNEVDNKLVGFITRIEAIIPTSAKSRLRVKDVARDYPILHPDDDVSKAYKLMVEHKVWGAPVVSDDGRLLGVVTMSDIIKYFLEQGYLPRSETISEILTTEDLEEYIITPDTRVNKVWSKFVFKGLPGLIVVRSKEDPRPIGIVTPFDLIKKGRWRFHREIEAGKIVTPAKVSRIMTRGVVVAGLDSRVEDVASVMIENDFTMLPVVDEQGKIVGIVTQADIVRAYLEGRKPGRVAVKPVPTPKPLEAEERLQYISESQVLQQVVKEAAPEAYVITGLRAADIARLSLPAITVNDTVEHARKEMLRRKTDYLIVLDEAGRIVGAVSKWDMLKAIALKGPIWRRRVYDKFFIDFIINKDVPKVREDDPIEKVALEMVSSKSDVAIVVDSEGNITGFITKDDLVDAYARTQVGRLQVANLMMPKRIGIVHPHHSLAHVIRKMQTFNLDAVTVYDGSRVLGVVSSNRLPFVAYEDALTARKSRRLVWVRRLVRAGRRIARYIKVAPLLAIHVTTPVGETVRPDDDILKAIEIMRKYNVDGVPVVDEEGRALGVLSKRDILREMARHAEIAIAREAEVKRPDAK
ncbi:MAG: CBS domain-containing protein [Desulfurococcales archaeon]|nr:CBS domain-containing protein [Desulfurococcales archaeon]